MFAEFLYCGNDEFEHNSVHFEREGGGDFMTSHEHHTTSRFAELLSLGLSPSQSSFSRLGGSGIHYRWDWKSVGFFERLYAGECSG